MVAQWPGRAWGPRRVCVVMNIVAPCSPLMLGKQQLGTRDQMLDLLERLCCMDEHGVLIMLHRHRRRWPMIVTNWTLW